MVVVLMMLSGLGGWESIFKERKRYVEQLQIEKIGGFYSGA